MIDDSTPRIVSALAARKQKPLTGGTLLFLGLILTLCGMYGTGIGVGVAVNNGIIWGVLGSTVSLAIGIPVLMSGVRLIRVGVRFCTIDPVTILTRDPRPAVLFLRSFLDDGKYLDRSVGLRTVEEKLVDALDLIGPVIAVGRPNERLPQAGAARLYIEDDRWQEEVISLLSWAGVVVLQIGKTPGLYWEVVQCIRLLRPVQLLLFLPQREDQSQVGPDSDCYDDFRNAAGSAFPWLLPRLRGESNFLGFDEGWIPIWLRKPPVHLLMNLRGFLSLRLPGGEISHDYRSSIVIQCERLGIAPKQDSLLYLIVRAICLIIFSACVVPAIVLGSLVSLVALMKWVGG
jgi:hypothetical protein